MDDIARLKALAGIGQASEYHEPKFQSMSGSEKRKYEREHNIKPGTEAWFRLWFAKTAISGELPHD